MACGFHGDTGCEGPNVAWYFHQAGYNTAILSYRLLPYDRYASMADMQRAIRLLRARKEEFGIGEKIVVNGVLCRRDDLRKLRHSF